MGTVVGSSLQFSLESVVRVCEGSIHPYIGRFSSEEGTSEKKMICLDRYRVCVPVIWRMIGLRAHTSDPNMREKVDPRAHAAVSYGKGARRHFLFCEAARAKSLRTSRALSLCTFESGIYTPYTIVLTQEWHSKAVFGSTPLQPPKSHPILTSS